ncbi:MAG: hypothetical protein JSV49_11140 [Thermoplasmata archaeon]|nr:MAG: hypothetical protein JSV49_11140 [Thermoplasmata archaeon]
MFGETVVWADDRIGNWDIYMYDLLTNIEIPLTEDPGNQDQPRIYGENIVWRDDRNGNYDIYMYNTVSTVESQLTTNTAHQSSPVISGTYVIWEDYRNGNIDLFLFDLNSQQEHQLTFGSGNEVNPMMFANTLVYLDDSDGDFEVYMGYLPASSPGLPTGPDASDFVPGTPGAGEIILTEVTQITDDNVAQGPPVTWGNYIVWSDSSGGNPDIYIYDTLTFATTQLTAHPAVQESPRIFGTTIVWEDYRNGNSDIYSHDIMAQSTKKIAESDSSEHSPVIYNDKIAFVSDFRGDDDIFLYTSEFVEWYPHDDPSYMNSGSSQEVASTKAGYGLAYGSVAAVVIAFILRSVVKRRLKPKEIKYLTVDDIDELKTKDELINKCKSLGLNTEGNKKRLRARLIKHVEAVEQERRERVERRAQLEREAEESEEEFEDEDYEVEYPEDFDFEAVDLTWDNVKIPKGFIWTEEEDAGD